MESGKNFIVGVVIGMLATAIVMAVMVRPIITKQRVEIARLNEEVRFANRQGEAVEAFWKEFLQKTAYNYDNKLPLGTDLPKMPEVKR